MIPILYEKDETLFVSNGLGRLRDCISCIVTEERNGIYECNFEYPISGAHFDDIQLGRIIGVEHDYSSDIQPFDIISYEKPIDGVVKFHCVHISYRQRNMVVSGTNINSLADAFTLLGTAQPSNPFTYQTDKDSTGYMAAADGIPRTVRSLLGGVEGSILDSYGGEYEWDKFNVILHDARGTQRNLTIRYGINMLDYNEDTDYASSYSAVIPYWTGSEGVTVTGSMVDSGAITYNGRTDCVPLDLTDKFESQPSTSDLEAMASSILASKQPYFPAQTIKVDFIRLQDTDEYKSLSVLFECKLCDSIEVIFPRYGMIGWFKIVKTTWDVLQERFDEMELGTLRTSLAEALGIDNGFGSSNGNGAEIIKTATMTCAGQGTTYMSYSVPSISGYTCIGVLGWQAGGSAEATTTMFDCAVNISNQLVIISRSAAQASAYTVIVQLLYVKNNYLG